MAANPTAAITFQNFFSAVLTSDITAVSTDIPLDNVPNGSEGFLVIEPDSTTKREVIYYNSKTAVKVVCPSAADGRGQDDTTATTHSTGAAVIMAPVANFFEVILNRICPTGSVIPYAGVSSPPSNWLVCDGSAVSRTTYAELFTAISTTFGSGDGSTTFNLPDLRGRNVVGAGTGTKVATFSSRSGNVITVTGLSNKGNNEFQTGQAVVFTSTGTTIGGLTSGNTYYVIRVSNTTFSLATSQANAVSGTAITLSSDGTGTRTFTLTFSVRANGESGGEEFHSQTTSELASHVHTYNAQSLDNSAGGSTQPMTKDQTADRFPSTNSTGSGTPANIMAPFGVLNYIIKT